MVPPKSPPEQQEAPFTPHYPAIEALIESEQFEGINKSFGAAYQNLSELAKQQGLRKSREAKQAMKALEKTMDLLSELLKLKYQYLKARGKLPENGELRPQQKASGGKQLHPKGTR